MEEARVPSTLIVDDEEDMRFLMRSTIEAANEGLEVTAEASDGFEAVERWREVQPDIVVMDNRNMSGLEVLQRLAANPAAPKFPVWVSTSAPDLAPEGIPCLPKPVDVQQLVALVRAHCQAEPCA